jgi:hypothetical protein
MRVKAPQRGALQLSMCTCNMVYTISINAVDYMTCLFMYFNHSAMRTKCTPCPSCGLTHYKIFEHAVPLWYEELLFFINESRDPLGVKMRVKPPPRGAFALSACKYILVDSTVNDMVDYMNYLLIRFTHSSMRTDTTFCPICGSTHYRILEYSYTLWWRTI